MVAMVDIGYWTEENGRDFSRSRTLPKIEQRQIDDRIADHLNTSIFSYGGDLLVVRSGGHPGNKAFQNRALQSIRLHKRHQRCIISSDPTSSVFGQAYVARHLLRFSKLPFYVPKGTFAFRTSARGRVMYREDFSDNRRAGEIVVLGEGEYLNVEQAADGRVVKWTSEEPPASYFKLLSRILGSPLDGDMDGHFEIDDEWYQEGSGTPEEVLEYFESKDDQVYTMSLIYPSLRATWSKHSFQVAGSGVTHHEASIFFRGPIDPSIVDTLIRATGSTALRSDGADARSMIRQLDPTK